MTYSCAQKGISDMTKKCGHWRGKAKQGKAGTEGTESEELSSRSSGKEFMLKKA